MADVQREGEFVMDKITIAIDTLGGDNGAEPMIAGISEAMSKYDDVSFIVTGREDELNTYIENYNCDKERIEIINAGEVITCHDAPVEAIRNKKESSLVLALNTVKKEQAQACISAGNSGAILAGGQLIVGRAKGVKELRLRRLFRHRSHPHF